jgi:hypothetical protein
LATGRASPKHAIRCDDRLQRLRRSLRPRVARGARLGPHGSAQNDTGRMGVRRRNRTLGPVTDVAREVQHVCPDDSNNRFTRARWCFGFRGGVLGKRGRSARARRPCGFHEFRSRRMLAVRASRCPPDLPRWCHLRRLQPLRSRSPRSVQSRIGRVSRGLYTRGVWPRAGCRSPVPRWRRGRLFEVRAQRAGHVCVARRPVPLVRCGASCEPRFSGRIGGGRLRCRRLNV